VADLVLVVVDASMPLSDDDDRLLAGALGRRVVVVNKIDLAPDAGRRAEELRQRLACDVVAVSASTTAGIDALRLAVARALTGRAVAREGATISNTRHVALLERARVHLDTAGRAAGQQSPEEFLLSDLQLARQAFDEIVGRRTTDDLLAHIFERFCIGK
jgi:tRNA modification GTPase